MNQPTVTEQPIYDNAGYVVPPDHRDHDYWVGVQAAQDEWKDAMCSDITDTVDQTLRNRLIQRQQVWRDVALDIMTGVVSPRAMHELRKALVFATQREVADATVEQKRARLHTALRLKRLNHDSYAQQQRAQSLQYTQKQIADALERLGIPTHAERKHTA